MLSENIRNNRKRIHLSQDELAEKVGVSRQSVSLWETGQTQPTIDNIIALTKIFNISSDMLLGNGGCAEAPQAEIPEIQAAVPEKQEGKGGRRKPLVIVGILIAAALALGALALSLGGNGPGETPSDASVGRAPGTVSSSSVSSGDSSDVSDAGEETPEVPPAVSTPEQPVTGGAETAPPPPVEETPEPPPAVSTPEPPAEVPFDLFAYCRDFAIQVGNLRGDYCIYQQPATRYGGYENEYFSISYWNDSNMVEFSLHCPLSETYSHNFYLRMRGGYDGKYEYVSSKYFRDTGESLREATGYIDPAVFSPYYPISCDSYLGSLDGQDQFMEDSRVGMCDLIWCLKEFVAVENMDCKFSDFEFVNF